MTWLSIGRPGVFADKRDEVFAGYNAVYGEGSWRIRHHYKDELLDFLGACKLYEASYLQDSYKRKSTWIGLRDFAKEVYDIDETDIASGLNYTIQEGKATHIQDIAIRNVLAQRDWYFAGTDLVQIRGGKKPFGCLLTPGKVPFIEPEAIVQPRLVGWWKKGSVEDFYQSNKVLQYKKKD